MSDFAEIPGTERCQMYHLRFHGGPSDGSLTNSFKPYDKMQLPDGSVYAATSEGESCLVWIDDWTKAIDLYYEPEGDLP